MEICSYFFNIRIFVHICLFELFDGKADDHDARCDLLKVFIEAETRRLDAKKTLKGMFDGTSKTADEITVESNKLDSVARSNNSDELSSPRFFDDEDAFQ